MRIKVKSAKPEMPTKIAQTKNFSRNEGFISGCIRIIISDIRLLITGNKTREQQEWEDYERFCKLARGEK